jgi:hypothetical protein
LKEVRIMKIPETTLIEKARLAIQDALQVVPGLTTAPITRPAYPAVQVTAGTGGNTAQNVVASIVEPDLIIRVTGPSVNATLGIEVKSSGEPRQVRTAIDRLRLITIVFQNSYGVVVAPYISPEAADLCKAEGMGYVDLSGNCRLSFDGIYIEREGRPSKFSEKRDLRTLYSAKASRVLRALFSEPGRDWKIAEIAEAAGVSLGLASNVKKLLADREWVRPEKRSFILIRPAELLAEWSENYSFRKSEAYDYYSPQSPADIEPALANVCGGLEIRYALTMFSAAARMAPAVRYQRIFAYVEGSVENVAERLGLKKVPSGANVTLLSPYDAGVFFGAKDFDGVTTVSPIQAYLDLNGYKGRGEEAAAEILKEVIEPQW